MNGYDSSTQQVVGQLNTAFRHKTALAIGGACGALVPLGTNHITHDLLRGDLVQLSMLTLLVIGGLVFSCLSVYSFARVVFGTWYKALGFVIALEGYMTFTTGWLSVTALVFLIAINAVTNGCRVAAGCDSDRRRARPRRAAPAHGRRSARPVLSIVAEPA